jgi:hypothetical protein
MQNYKSTFYLLEPSICDLANIIEQINISHSKFYYNTLILGSTILNNIQIYINFEFSLKDAQLTIYLDDRNFINNLYDSESK